MPFFEVLSEDAFSPEARPWIERWLELFGYEKASRPLAVWGRSPDLMEVRVRAAKALHFEVECVSREARYIAAMLMAHARRCQGCFSGSRAQLDRLGFDGPALDRICVDPDTLPLGERERAFVKFALKTAAGAADLTAADFGEMAGHGFSRAEVLDIVGFVAFWTMNMVLTSAVFAGLAEEVT